MKIRSRKILEFIWVSKEISGYWNDLILKTTVFCQIIRAVIDNCTLKSLNYRDSNLKFSIFSSTNFIINRNASLRAVLFSTDPAITIRNLWYKFQLVFLQVWSSNGYNLSKHYETWTWPRLQIQWILPMPYSVFK